MAMGSACEVESQMLVAERLGILKHAEELLREVDSVRLQLIRLQQRLDTPETRTYGLELRTLSAHTPDPDAD